MRSTDVDELRGRLTSALAPVTGASVALSGSLSRGDFRTRDGQVVSDLDLIPVIRSEADAGPVRAQLAPVLRSLSDDSGLTVSAAITLADNFFRVRHAAYVTSMATRPFISDPLGLQAHLDGLPERASESVLPWLAQPVAYYLAKSGFAGREENIGKAVGALRRLLAEPELAHTIGAPTDDPTGDVPPSDLTALYQVCTAALGTLAADHGVRLLPSSAEFLARAAEGDTGEATFRAVRDRAFLENQGLPFELSCLTARPTPASDRSQ